MREVNEMYEKSGTVWTVREDAILLCYLKKYEGFLQSDTRKVSGEEKYKFAEKIQTEHFSVLGGRQTGDIHPHLDHLLKLAKDEYSEERLKKIKKSDIENYHRLWL